MVGIRSKPNAFVKVFSYDSSKDMAGKTKCARWSRATERNALKIFSYIPIIGLIVYSVLLAKAYAEGKSGGFTRSDMNKIPEMKAFLGRAIMCIVGIGAVVFILDQIGNMMKCAMKCHLKAQERHFKRNMQRNLGGLDGLGNGIGMGNVGGLGGLGNGQWGNLGGLQVPTLLSSSTTTQLHSTGYRTGSTLDETGHGTFNDQMAQQLRTQFAGMNPNLGAQLGGFLSPEQRAQMSAELGQLDQLGALLQSLPS